MKKLLPLLACLVGVTCQAGETIITTIAIPGTVTNSVGGRDWSATETNAVVIPNGQAARVATIRPRPSIFSENVWFEKSGVVSPAGIGDVIAGPAVFYLRNEPPNDALLTLERWTVKKAK